MTFFLALINFSQIDKILAKKLFSMGGWMAIIAFAGMFNYYLDRFLISSFLGPVVLAGYNAGIEIATRLNMLPGSITAGLFPSLSYWHKEKNYSNFRSSVLFTLRLCTFLLVFASGLLFYFSTEIIDIWLGEGFSDISAKILKLMAIGIALNGLTVIPIRAVASSVGPSALGRLYIKIAFVFCLLNVFFIYSFGVFGAVYLHIIRSFLELIIFMKILTKDKIIFDSTTFGEYFKVLLIMFLSNIIILQQTTNFMFYEKIVIFTLISLLNCAYYYFSLLNHNERKYFLLIFNKR